MKTQRTIMIVAFYLFLALFYLRSCLFLERTPSDLALSVCICVTATLACIADSRIRGRPMSPAAKWVMAFIWPIAVPIYLFWSRGWRGIFPLLAHALITGVLLIGTPLLTIGILNIQPR